MCAYKFSIWLSFLSEGAKSISVCYESNILGLKYEVIALLQDT